MTDTKLQNTIHDISRAYFNNGSIRAKEMLDNTIKTYPGSKDELDARFFRARGYEAGWFGPINNVKAKIDYIYLIENKNKIAGIILNECYLGCARILYSEKESIEEIKRLCKIIMASNGNRKALTLRKALILLGFAYETMNKDYKTAAEYFLSSFYKGSKRGLAYYSYAKFKSGNYIIGTMSLILYYIVYPILRIFDKSKSAVF